MPAPRRFDSLWLDFTADSREIPLTVQPGTAMTVQDDGASSPPARCELALSPGRSQPRRQAVRAIVMALP